MNTLKTLTDAFSYKFKAIIENCENRETKTAKIRRYEHLRTLLSNINYLADMAEKGFISGEEEQELREKIGEFITKYCTHQSKHNKYEENFPELREIAMFTIDYERKHLRVPVQNKFKTNTELTKIKTMRSHYIALLEDPNLSEEQRESYNCFVDEMDARIIELTSNKLTRSRGINNETTEY